MREIRRVNWCSIWAWFLWFPPKSNRVEPWAYDKALYKKRNEIERLFRRLKGFRRIFSRFEKLDLLFIGFLNFALIVEALR
jgi:transposase